MLHLEEYNFLLFHGLGLYLLKFDNGLKVNFWGGSNFSILQSQILPLDCRLTIRFRRQHHYPHPQLQQSHKGDS